MTWLIQKDGDDRAYEIQEYDASLNKIILAENYAGATSVDAGYRIFSRANVIWVSNPGFPEGFRPLNFINGPNGELSGDLTASLGYSASMLFWSLSGMYRLSFDLDPLLDGVLEPISQQRGALTTRVVIKVETTVYAMDHLGWYAWNGVFPEHISRPIDDIRPLIDYDQAENFHAICLPDIRAIRWYVSYTGDTYPKNYVQLDVDTGNWSTGEHEIGISESRLVPTDDGPQVFLGDENGHLWIADRGLADGCDEAFSHLEVGIGSTTTLIPIVTPILPTINVGLGGCFAHWVEGNEDRLITSNNSSSITVSPGFSSAPGEGDEVWIGSIPTKLKTRAFLAPQAGIRHVKRDRYCWIAYEPTTAGKTRRLRVRKFNDYSPDPATWGDKSWRLGNAEEEGLPGLQFPGKNPNYPDTEWLVDTSKNDGLVRVPMGGDFNRALEVELEMREPDADLEIFQLDVGAEEGERLA